MKNTSRAATVKMIALLAWPTVVEQVLQTAVSYVDSAMVGRIGPAATAAVGVTTTINWLIGSSVSALGVGFLAYIAKEIGAGRPKSAARATSQATLAVILVGALFTALALALSGVIPRWMQAAPEIQADASRYFFIIYIPMIPRAATAIFGTCLRAAGDTKTPMRVNALMNVVNVAFNFLLIYPTRAISLFGLNLTMPGAGMGVTGAAIASAIAFALGGIGMTIAVFRHPVISPRGCSMKPDPEILRPCLRVALPSALQRFGTSFGYVAFSAMINGLGTVSLAAHSIANTAESAFYIPGYGMQAAAATLAGNTYGEGDRDKMRRLTRTLIAMEALVMTLSGLLLFALAPQVMGIFTQDEEVIRLGATVLRMVAVSEPVYGISIILEGIFQGVGDTMHTFAFNIIGMWGVRILGTYITLQHMGLGLTAAWGCMIAHNLALGVMLATRYKRGKWNPLLREKTA